MQSRNVLVDKYEHVNSVVVEGFDDPIFVEALEIFARDLPHQIAVLRQSLHTSDVESMKRVAHQLKGSASCFGLDKMTECAIAVEAVLGTVLNPDVLEKLISRMDQIATMLTQEVAQHHADSVQSHWA